MEKCDNGKCKWHDRMYKNHCQSYKADLATSCESYLMTETASGSKVPCSDGVMPKWIVVAQEPHPVGIEFIAYYGNGSKEKRITCLGGRDLAISLWLPLPELPEA
jgi:hypothetical protein